MRVDRTTSIVNNEFDQLLGLKPTRPHVVTLALDHLQRHGAPKFHVSFSQHCRIFLQWNYFVFVTMDVKYRDVGLGEQAKSINRVVIFQIRFELVSG